MRRLAPLVLLALLVSTLAGAAPDTSPVGPGFPEVFRQGERLARELTLTTGVAVTPLLGVVLLGAGRYLASAEADRAGLPWHAAPRFWGPAAILLALLFLKDSSKIALPKLLIVPLDALETLLEKNLSGLLALPVLVSAVAGGEFAALQALGGQLADCLLPAAWAVELSSAAAPGPVAALFGGCVAAIIYTAVWVFGQACNILILLSPSSLLDTLLTTIKTSVAVVLLGLSSTPVGQLFALALVLPALWLFPRTLRLVVFGTLVSRDLVRHRLLGRPATEPESGRPVRCFTSCSLGPVPPLTCGRLQVKDDRLAFSHRPFLVGRTRTLRTTIRPADCQLARGFLSPVVCHQDGRGPAPVQLFRLLPASAAHLDRIAAHLGMAEAAASPALARLVEAWRWCRSLFALPAVIAVQETGKN